MPYKFNPFTGTLDYYETGSGGGGGGSTVVVTHVANYAALPDPTTVADDAIYIADAAQGTAWLPGSLGGTYYPAGFYSSDGVSWVYAGSASQATLSEVNTGTNNDKFVTPSTFTNADKWGTKFDQPSGTTAQYIKGDGTIGFFPTNSALSFLFSSVNSDIGGYESAPIISLFSTGAISSLSTSVTTTPTLLGVFATNLNYPNITVIPPGTILCHYETQKNAGSVNYYSFFELYKRTAGGTETLLLTSDNSSEYSSNTQLQITTSAFTNNPITLLTTDRLIVKIYAAVLSSTATITFYYDDNTNARLELPFSPDVSSYQPLDTDLTAIASLSTTSYGRDLLTQANASAVRTYIGAGTGNGDALTSGKLSQFATTTSSELAGVISDETGSGALVFGTNPTLSNPIVGTQTANDNSTKAASTAYVDTAVSSISSSGGTELGLVMAIRSGGFYI
jgi:hypothetical protein